MGNAKTQEIYTWKSFKNEIGVKQKKSDIESLSNHLILYQAMKQMKILPYSYTLYTYS